MSANENIRTNGTQLPSCYNPTAGKIGQTFAYCLIFVVSLAGNIFIGIIVYKTRTMRKPINFLIVNMAMSDLLMSIVLIPRNLTYLYFDSWLIRGPLGQALCKLVYFLGPVSSTVSVQSLVVITVDRFGAVVFPLRLPRISSKRCPLFILVTWIIAMAIWSPELFAMGLVEYPGGLACVRQWNKVFGESSSFKNYILAVFFVIYYTPLVLVVILYTIICLKLHIQTVPGKQSANARQQRVQRERNLLKMSIAIVLGFAVCWLLYSIMSILFKFVSHIWSCGFQYFGFVSVSFFYASSAINPCICFILSGNYRQALKNLFRCV